MIKSILSFNMHSSLNKKIRKGRTVYGQSAPVEITQHFSNFGKLLKQDMAWAYVFSLHSLDGSTPSKTSGTAAIRSSVVLQDRRPYTSLLREHEVSFQRT